jgi:FAD/FMN-containing dehydrogenase
MFQPWGRIPSAESNIKVLSDIDEIARTMHKHKNSIAYGAGRSYGDVCQPDSGTLLVTANLDRFRSFDSATGELSVEAGVLLRDIQRHFTPLGWALPVTPGTQLITVGGAIANDIHGKSHHVHGTFGHQVVKFTLIRSDGEVIECSPTKNPKWFAATIGGIGLTGVISKATLKMQRIAGPWIDTETIPFGSIEEFFRISAKSNSQYENSVSWIDCTSRNSNRGLLMIGNRSNLQKPAKFKDAKTFPFEPPVSLVNKLTLKPGNMAYYALSRIKPAKSTVHYEKFFYPLDGINEWNKVYGPKGFYQYQSVIPPHNALDATKEMLKVIGASGQGSMLGVLKEFGTQNSLGLLSFPMAGTTLALDFPNRGTDTEKLFAKLDEIVKAAEGRLYLAKDARMPREMFETTYLNLNKFKKFRDPNLSSAMSKRLMGN